MSEVPLTQFTEVDGLNIAYQVSGSGPFDLVVVSGFFSHIEAFYDLPGYAEWIERLGRFARVIVFDKRGSGMSDRLSAPPTLEERMADVRAVMDAVGSKAAWIFGVSEGGPISLVFAATYPERTKGLVLYNTYARACSAPDYPWGPELEAWHEIGERFKPTWGEPASPLADFAAPSMVKDGVYQQAFARSCRLSFPPGGMMQMWELAGDIDVRELLPSVNAPALVLSREGDVAIPCDHGRFLGEHLPQATFHLLPGADHLAHLMGDEAIRLIEEFITGQSATEINVDRILASVLFTDIVGSTELASAMGDKDWRAHLDRHDELVARQINRFDGKLIERSGDGTLATFDGPARAIACAQAIRDGVVGIDLQIRAGLHLGEVELRGDRIGGIAVHLAARIMSAAEAGEVLVSRTIKDVVVGSGVTFAHRGAHHLKGFDETWELFAV